MDGGVSLVKGNLVQQYIFSPKVKVMDRVHLDTIPKKATKKHLETMKSKYHVHLQNGVSSI
ncbi:unnamed protein product [Rhodiola kirilowii]